MINSKSNNTAWNMLRYSKCSFKNLAFNCGALYRSIDYISKRKSPLVKLKNNYLGKRCFLIATGPSLIVEDVLCLKGEYTFSMNSICKLFEQTDWRPTFYGIQDVLVYDRLESIIKQEENMKVFVGSNIKKCRKVPDNWISFPLNVAYHDYDRTVHKKYYARFSNDCYKVVYNGYSITYSLLQIACYLGFREIYILGADNNYCKEGKQHFMEHGHFASDADEATFRLNAAYEEAKRYVDKNNIKIYNATRGGMLDVFPRVNFDDLLLAEKQ